EHVFVGLAAGYGVYVIWRDVLVPTWWTPLTVRGEWWWIFAGVAGGMYYTLYSKRFSWMSRLVMLPTMGFTAGQAFRFWAGTYVRQISSAMSKPLFYAPLRPPVHPANHFPLLFRRIPAPYIHLDNLLFAAILACVLTHFLFSFE